jgi:hypothetical protein
VYSLEKGFAVRRPFSLAQEALAFTPIDVIDTARYHGETGPLCLPNLATSTLGHPIPDSIQVTEVINDISKTSRLPKS